MARQADSVLVVDDDLAVGTVLVGILGQEGLDAHHASSAAEALERLDEQPFDAAIVDVRMPGMDGMQLLRELGRRWPGLPVLMLTAHGTVALAVEAMKAGAKTFLLKPFERDEVVYELRRALTASRHASTVPPAHNLETHTILGDCAAMRQLGLTIERVAGVTATVLIQGESGTGKELVARALHARSPRRDKPFVAVQCGAVPDTLLEDELFGHEKGAFTGAVARKLGRIELAAGGTLFLDEIGDISLAAQVKLLRVLQERQFERLGGTGAVTADVRVVTATHRDLPQMCAAGEFREDLYYRLNVVPIRIPALRERKEDVPLLAKHFCAHFAREYGRPAHSLSPEALDALVAYDFPGNVRELQNLVERLVVLATGPLIGEGEVRGELGGASPSRRAVTRAGDGAPLDDEPTTDGTLPDVALRAQCQRIHHAIAQCRGNRTAAARLLGVSRRTLYNKLEECRRLG